jgi:hypothetical protein
VWLLDVSGCLVHAGDLPCSLDDVDPANPTGDIGTPCPLAGSLALIVGFPG